MNSELRKGCPMRHENGNCMPAGGFCTANNDCICKALHNAYEDGYVARQGGRWISVKDRLPEKTGDYLVWVQWPYDEFPTISIVNYDEDCEAFGEWHEYIHPHTLGSLGSDFESIDVMFWMPLPEPPREAK